MKKLSILACMLLGIFALASCDSDRDDNPTLHVPDSFTLLEPTIGDNPIDLLVSTSVPLVAQSQPAYGMPTQVTYTAQMSMTNNFTDSAQFYTLDASTTSTTLDVPTSQINLGVMTLRDYTDESQVNTDSAQVVYIRLKAQTANDPDGTTAVYSNVQQIRVLPYFEVRTVADPDYWFMVGSCIGSNGTWGNGNDANALLGLFPLSEVKDASYDTKTGKGEFESIIYMPDGGMMKLKHYADSWDPQWAWSNGATFKKNIGDSGNPDNITPTNGAGFYVVHLNTATDQLTFTKSDTQTYPTYGTMGIIGVNDDWNNDIAMSPSPGTGANNHLWTAHLTVTATTSFKFRADGAWDNNWGYGANNGDVALKGFGVSGGSNIGIEPGDYVIYFNDIDQFFRIVKVGEKLIPEGATE